MSLFVTLCLRDTEAGDPETRVHGILFSFLFPLPLSLVVPFSCFALFSGAILLSMSLFVTLCLRDTEAGDQRLELTGSSSLSCFLFLFLFSCSCFAIFSIAILLSMSLFVTLCLRDTEAGIPETRVHGIFLSFLFPLPLSLVVFPYL